MYFHSLQFLAFGTLLFGAYWAVHRSVPLRLGTLLVGSLLFYAAWTPFPLLLFASSALVEWLCVKGMVRWPRAKKALLVVAVGFDLSMLGLFKYGDLFASTGAWLLGHLGLAVRHESLGLLLPVGLSFVAFQGISLVVDVYRGQVEPRHTYPEHLLYLLFFPQVVAGPIVRARDLLARFRQTPRLDPETGARGLYRIATGMAKKLLIADVLAAGLVDRVFEDPSLYTSAECLAATLAYTFQLYCDFSAYSDIAIGAAALFGFALPENFAKPYLARNLFEFWNRWHISLSTWLRDYLYIPLGGNRCSRPRVLFNLMVVMTLGGLWHGASWRFALWGAVHGVGLVVTRVWWWLRGGRPKEHSWYGAAAGMAATFTVVVLTRIVFRCADLPAAGRMVRALAELSGGLANVSLPVWAALAAAALSHALPPAVYERSAGLFARLPVPVRAAALVGLALVVRQVAAVELRPYIYFQF